MKKFLVPIVIILVVLGVGGYARYSATLSASKADTASLDNRAISDADFLDDWAKTDEAKEYREDQEKMASEQTVFGEELGEMMEKPQPPAPISTGSFNKIDAIHFAKGGVEVISEGDDVYIILTQDFSTPRGPDLYVLLSKNTDDTYTESDALNIGPLTDIKGRQIYKITRDEFDAYNGSVKIRCRAFDTMFSVARLQ